MEGRAGAGKEAAVAPTDPISGDSSLGALRVWTQKPSHCHVMVPVRGLLARLQFECDQAQYSNYGIMDTRCAIGRDARLTEVFIPKVFEHGHVLPDARLLTSTSIDVLASTVLCVQPALRQSSFSKGCCGFLEATERGRGSLFRAIQRQAVITSIPSFTDPSCDVSVAGTCHAMSSEEMFNLKH